MTEPVSRSRSLAAETAPIRSERGRILAYYAIAGVAAIFGLAVMLALISLLRGEVSYLFFVPATLIASAFGGFGPGLFATALGLALGVAYIAADRALSTADLVNAFAFAVIGVGIAWLSRYRGAAAQSAEAALAREAHMQSILDSIPDAMIVIDERGIMQAFSAAAERLFGCSTAEALGKNVSILMLAPYKADHDHYIGMSYKIWAYKTAADGTTRVYSDDGVRFASGIGEADGGTSFESNLSWDAVSGADGYVIEADIYESQNGTGNLSSWQDVGNVTSYTGNGLANHSTFTSSSAFTSSQVSPYTAASSSHGYHWQDVGNVTSLTDANMTNGGAFTPGVTSPYTYSSRSSGAIGAAFGGQVVRAKNLMHGKTSQVEHDGKTIFRELTSPMTATRYHSLIVSENDLPSDLEVSAWTFDKDGTRVVMGLRHKKFPVEGVQFHPESVLTGEGKKLVANFLRSSPSQR